MLISFLDESYEYKKSCFPYSDHSLTKQSISFLSVPWDRQKQGWFFLSCVEMKEGRSGGLVSWRSTRWNKINVSGANISQVTGNFCTKRSRESLLVNVDHK